MPQFSNVGNPSQRFLRVRGQGAVQYLLMVAIVSVAVMGVVQARFTAFKSTMQSVKHEMAQVIGGSRRLPQRWYAKEMEDYSAAVASLRNRSEPLASTADQEGAEMADGAQRARAEKAAGGEGAVEAETEMDTRGYGQGFYAGSSDSGFGGNTSQLASVDAGELSGSGASKKDKTDKTSFGGGGGEDFGGDEFGTDQEQISAQLPGGKRHEDGEVAQETKESKKTSDALEEEATQGGSIKKALGAEEEEKKGGKVKLDWATIIKLILIIAIIVVLIILLLGSVGGRSSEE